MQKQCAYSLLELVLTVAVASIVIALAVPSFGDTLARQRQRAEIDALFRAMYHAKKASVTHHDTVTVCASADGEQCIASADWSVGWMMFVNHDRDSPPQRDDDEPRLKVHSVHPNVEISSNRRYYTLRSTRRRATNGTLVVCDRTGRVAPRALVVSFTGRPRVASETTRGRAYRCPD
ncbi:MAG: GspH/FimT family pseudopilin [Pseudomonadota bacterium]